jgi:LPS-assembly protein
MATSLSRGGGAARARLVLRASLAAALPLGQPAWAQTKATTQTEVPGQTQTQGPVPGQTTGAPPPAAGGMAAKRGNMTPVSKDQPVTFTADQVTFDRDTGIVTASGNVDAWQNDHEVRADKIIFDRNTNVAAANGHVVILEPDGEVMFADYAELTEGMKDAVLRGMRALLVQNGRLAANGARRTGGEINEMSKLVYSTCNICVADPSKPPLWQIRAYNGVQDLEHKRIEFYDATIEAFGIPVGYLPYFNTADPSSKRSSGFLIPIAGNSSSLGLFAGIPYYGVLDDQSDFTLTPLVTSRQGAQADLDYRRRFNDGELEVNLSAGTLTREANATATTVTTSNGSNVSVIPYTRNPNSLGVQESIFATGKFAWDDTWRYGFTLDRASSVNYLNDYNQGQFFGSISNVLTSNIYVEGFGTGAYSKLDATFFQSLDTSIAQTTLPIVLPRYEYSYFGQVDPWGGRFSLDTEDFNVLRNIGTSTQRADLILNYERPFTGAWGDLWKAQAHLVNAAYNATAFNEEPNYAVGPGSIQTARTMPQAAVDVKWPFMRDSGDWGTQVIEPHAQIIVGPNMGNHQYQHIPNEDSFDLEFTDANLFAWNRFPGIDELEGGSRANVALHGAWYLNGTVLDAQIGQSYQTERLTEIPFSGLTGPVSDYVGHVSFQPTPWLDAVYRFRLDHDDFKSKMDDAVVMIGKPVFNVSTGYLYTSNNPYTLYDQSPLASSPLFYIPRNEVTVGMNTKLGQYKFSGYARRDLQTNQMVAVGADATFENECFIFDIRFTKRYTSVNGDNGYETVLFTITLKTIGAFGFHAS